MGENKNVCGDIPLTYVFIFPHSFLKIKISMEMPMETFHRHLWQGMWENKNVYGNFPMTFVGRNVGK
jgi:hypothetical protein